MASLPEMFDEAIEHHRAGRYDAAARLYDSILEQAPQHANTLHLRGFVGYLTGDLTTALCRIEAAIAQDPKPAVFHAHLGLVQQALGRSGEAASSFHRSLKSDPAQSDALAGLGAMALLDNRDTDARDLLLKAVQADPHLLPAWINLAQACYRVGDYAAAEAASRRGIALAPAHRDACFWLALTMSATGRVDEAEANYRTILSREPSFAPAAINLANLLRARGEDEAAARIYDDVISLDSSNVDALYARAVLRHELADRAGACADYRAVLKVCPGHQLAAENLGSLLRMMGEYDESLDVLRRLVKRPDARIEASVTLGNSLAETGRWDEARAAFAHVARRREHDWLAKLRVARLCPLLAETSDEIDQYREELGGVIDELLAVRRLLPSDVELATSGCEPSFNLPFHGRDDRPLKEKYARLFENQISPVHRSSKRTDSRPHVGIVVTDLNESLFARSMVGIINRLSNSSLRLSICCSLRGWSMIKPDLWSEETGFVQLDDTLQATGERLASAAFDLLYFWEIATDSMNYFLPFLRCAPVQCTSWGIQVTSGIPAMDYYVSSRWVEPADGERHYSERLVLLDSLPSLQSRRAALAREVERGDFGISGGEHLYVCPQNPGKYHPEFIRILAEILDRDPSARIVLTGSKHPVIQAQLEGILSRRLGDARKRLTLFPPLPVAQYHQLIQVADVMLDPFPFAGVNSTYDAFSFNQPIVTLDGRFHRGRFTAGCYRAMGLGDWVALDASDYVERAIRWGANSDERIEARRVLVERTPVLFDDPCPAAELEQFFLKASSARH